MKKYIKLFLLMLKIGLFTFGGGYAMIALLEDEFVRKRDMIDKEEFLDMVAIAESTPGPVAINAATYLGYKLYGVLGSIVATIAVCIPSFVIIYVISLFFDAFLSLKFASYAFMGIQVCVVYLILSAGLRMLSQMKKNIFNIGILSVVIILMLCFSIFSVNFSTIFYILICGAFGVFMYMLSIIKNKKKEEEK